MKTIRGLLMVGILAGAAPLLVAHSAPQRPTVGFIGDSITAAYGVPATVGMLLGVGVVNRGVSGSRSAQWLPGVPHSLLPGALQAFRQAGARVVHVMLGTNDARPNWRTTPATYSAHIAAICRALRRAGFVPVVSNSPYAVPGAYRGTKWAIDPATDGALQSYRSVLRQLVHSGVCVAGDTAAYALTHTHPSLLWDGIHPTATGARALARLWAAALAPAL